MKQRRLGVYVMIDALGFRFLRDVEFMPELEFRVGLRTVLGYSCACQPTLLTGRLPHEHGHGAMFQRANGHTPLAAARRFSWLPSIVADNYRIRNRVYGKVSTQVDGYFSLYECPMRLLPEFDLVEHDCIFEPGSMRRGTNVFDRFQELGLKYRHYYWKTPEEDNLLAAEDDVRSGEVEMLFVYLPALDGLLHEHGSQGEAVHTHLRWYQDRLRRLREVAEEQADEVEFFVFSDHGMSDVHGSIDLVPDIEGRFGRNGKRYLAFYDSTMARFWSDDTALLDELTDMLGQRSDGRCIAAEEKPDLGIAFDDRSQGDLHYVVNEGLLIVPSYMGRSMLAGMHGYHPDAVDADACLLGNFSPSLDPTHIKHIYDLMDATAVRLVEDRA